MQYLKLQKCGKGDFLKKAKESYEILALIKNSF
jgi:hypothetical protein